LLFCAGGAGRDKRRLAEAQRSNRFEVMGVWRAAALLFRLFLFLGSHVL